ncbi:MAG: cupin domain-containing protein [Calditrichaceae bacterium]|nr:cupin domain-containing protein [Calditrichaceae bacterium]
MVNNNNLKKEAGYWIQKLNLQKHPEGGYYRETYRSNEIITKDCLPNRYDGNRSFYTSIYFLLIGNDISAFHRIKSDEIWHFYYGSSMTIYRIDPDGMLFKTKIGDNLENGELFQTYIKAGHWFGAKINDPNSFSLAGCTVAPGFDFSDFELGSRKDLIKAYPRHREIIEQLTLP